MRILAIDTATARGSVALTEDARVLASAVLDAGQGRALAPAIRDVLAAHGGLAAVDGVALSIGPGSFTGLRIGLAFVKGLVIAEPKPVVAISTLELITRAAGGAAVLAAIDARNGEVFARLDGIMEDGLRRIDAVVAALDGHPPGILAGEPPPALEAALPGWARAPASDVPLAITLAALAEPRFRAGEGRDPADLQPSYGQPAAVDRKRATVDTPASHS